MLDLLEEELSPKFGLAEDNDARNDIWSEVFQLVRQPVVTVLRYVFGITNADDQDDMLQEVMLRFYRSHRSHDHTRPLLPWLYAVARHVKLDWLARNRKFQDHCPLTEVEQAATDNTMPKLIAQELLAKLPEDDRHILWLSYNEELTNDEISRELNIPLTKTKHYLRRARQRALALLSAQPSKAEIHET